MSSFARGFWFCSGSKHAKAPTQYWAWTSCSGFPTQPFPYESTFVLLLWLAHLTGGAKLLSLSWCSGVRSVDVSWGQSLFLFTSSFQGTDYKCYDKNFELDIFIFFSSDQVFHHLSLANQRSSETWADCRISITSKTADLVTTGPASQGSELSSCFNSGRAVQAHFLGFFIDQTHLFLVLSLYVFMDLFLGIPVVQRPLTCPCQVHPTKMGTHGCRSLLYFSLLMERHGEIL